MKTKRKGYRPMRFRKDDVEHNVLVAVSRWIRARGGSVIVIGGIETQDWELGDFRYKVAVNCVGRKPEKPKLKVN